MNYLSQIEFGNRKWKTKVKPRVGKKYTVWPVSVERLKAVIWDKMPLVYILSSKPPLTSMFLYSWCVYTQCKEMDSYSERPGLGRKKTCVSVPSRKEMCKTERRPEPSCSVCRCSLAVPLRSHSSDNAFPGCTAFSFARVPMTVNSSRGRRR